MIKRSKSLSGLLAATLLAGSALPSLAIGAKPGGSDWPCPQRKVEKLGAADLQWEGPPIDGVKGWVQDEPVNAMVNALSNRRIAVEDAIKALTAFSEKLPAAERSSKLTLIFAGLLDTVNVYRTSIISGIERFDRRQKARAAEIEQEGVKLGVMEKAAEGSSDEAVKAEYAKAQELYEWNTRVFEERRQNLPLACEIPPAIDARMFEIVRAMNTLIGAKPPG